MPKHLYTIPSGTTLPDVTGLPEGYPFLLVTSDETVAGQLYLLQGSAFVQPTASAGAAPTLRTPVTFGFLIPAKPTADATPQDITVEGGLPNVRFVVPAGLASGSTTVAQLREVTMALDAATPPVDVISLTLTVDGTTFPPTAMGGPEISTSQDHSQTNVIYNAATTANHMPAGSVLVAGIHVGGAYANPSDALVTVTLWFGEPEGGGSLLEEGGARREQMLNERERDLEKAEQVAS